MRTENIMTRSIARIVGSAAAVLFAGAAAAQTYPGKPITLIVPFAPGASADGIARIVGRELSQALGQPVVVDNKPGAGGALGLMTVAKAAADGYPQPLFRHGPRWRDDRIWRNCTRMVPDQADQDHCSYRRQHE